MIKIHKNILKSLDLREDEYKVYTAALMLGEASMQDLATRSGVKRSTIYTFIDKLKDRGLIQETAKGKRKVYSAVEPEQLLEIEKTRLKELEQVIPELKAIHNKSRKKPKVTFYEGIEGIEAVYADVLKEKKEVLTFEDLDQLKKMVSKSFYQYFPPERSRKGILLKSISRDSEFAREFTKRNIGLLRETKFIKTESLKTDINIYADKVALMSLNEQSPFCVLIEDPNIAQTLRLVWNELWNRLDQKIG
jgi:HTH-type transcriptional regulator, sugar sensing transcriptional regulator